MSQLNTIVYAEEVSNLAQSVSKILQVHSNEITTHLVLNNYPPELRNKIEFILNKMSTEVVLEIACDELD
jgi:hypothetical protein